MMNSIELPLAIENNPIKAIQYFIPAIVLTEADSLPWLYNNYIHLEWVENDCIRFGINNINISFAEPIKTYILSRSMIKDNAIDIISFIKNNLIRKQYVQLTLDEYYIKGKKHYQKDHILHDNLIYGFSDMDFMLYGYGNSNVLQKNTLSMEAFLKSFYFDDNLADYRFSSHTYADLLYVFRKIQSDYQTDLHSIIEQIEDFLVGNDYSKRYREARNPSPSTVSGIKIYEKLKKLYSESNGNRVDIRNACVIRDHKQLMISRLDYLQKLYSSFDYTALLCEANTLEKKSEQLVYLSIKYNLSRNNSIISRAVNLISDMQIMDSIFMEAFKASCNFLLQ